jgi:ADP-L-glycero-D-manno-heptose 6-epimerase
MKILLTGHRGFIGSHLLKALQKNHSVSLYEWSDPVLPDVAGHDWVVHTGAISSTTEQDVEKVMRQNVDFSIALYEQCRYHGVNFQFSSSASVYGLGSVFCEDAPVDPRTPYAWSKYLVERHIEQVPPRGMLAQCFRYFNVYGPEGEEHKGSQASPFMQFKKQAEETGTVQLFDISAQRDFVHVSQVVNTHVKFFGVPVSGTFNVGTGTTKSFAQVAALYTDNVQIIPMPENLKHSYQMYTCANMTKTNNVLTN